VLLLSCAVPYYERARGTEGFSGGIGLGIAGGSMAAFHDPYIPPVFFGHIAPKATLFTRYGFTRGAGVFLQTTTGLAYAFAPSSFRPRHGFSGAGLEELTELQLGGKFSTSSADALRVGVGATLALHFPYNVLVDVAWLHDVGLDWTSTAAIGTRGLSLGITRHWWLGSHTTAHLALTGTLLPPYGFLVAGGLQGSAQLGFAIEAARDSLRPQGEHDDDED
jgi:hypothetical protein